jgi:hypothetical protein
VFAGDSVNRLYLKACGRNADLCSHGPVGRLTSAALPPMNARRVLLLGLFVFSSFATVSIAPSHAVRLNQDSFRFAQELIEQDHFIADKNGAWSEHRPSAKEQNEFIRAGGFAEYAKWHLGTDLRHGEDSKAHYKFPFGDFENVHRSALIAIKSRAREYGYTEIENAAAELQRSLEQKARSAQ